MTALLMLAASLAFADGSTDTVKAPDAYDQGVRISNLAKDVRDLQSGHPKITGKPTYRNGFCFADGTCQTTAASTSYDATITTFTTRIPSATGTNTTFAGCIAGTSITTSFLVAKSTAMAVLSISARKSDAGNYLEPTVTMDGTKSLSNDTATDLYIVQPVAGTDILIHLTTFWINASTGPHTFCFGIGQNAAGTWNLEGGVGTFSAGVKR